ncbi:MAG TPA: hypothetical protein VFR55_03960 [Dehalococcoidia bacterium]|nr:hypothetical protein [Dehalococcoidia bacterium]
MLLLPVILSLLACVGTPPANTTGSAPTAPNLQQVRYAYVSNAADGSVSIIDLNNDQVVDTVQTGEVGAHGIAASPDGRFGYAALEGVNEVVVIDGESQQVAARITVPYSTGMMQHGVDISPDGRYLWVGARQGGENRGEVVLAELAVINTGTRQVEEVLQTGLGVPSHYAMTPDGSELWVASTTVDLVWVVDTQQRQVVAAIPVVPPRAERPAERRQELAGARIIALNEVAISPDGKMAYAVGPVDDLVFAIDIPSRKLVGSVKSSRSAHGIVVSRDGQEIWTADWGGTLTVIDVEKLQVKETITLGGRPNHIAFSQDGRKAYVTRTGDDPEIGEVLVLDTATRQLVNSLRVGKGPHEISLEDTPSRVLLNPTATEPRAAAPAGSNPASADTGRREDAGAGSVTFAATPAEPTYLADKGHPRDHWGFVVQLDTHSVDLTGLDLVDLTMLRDGQGREFKPVAWQGLSEDSHHRSGLLVFSSQDAGGPLLSNHNSRPLELVLRDVAGVKKRMLRWD